MEKEKFNFVSYKVEIEETLRNYEEDLIEYESSVRNLKETTTLVRDITLKKFVESQFRDIDDATTNFRVMLKNMQDISNTLFIYPKEGCIKKCLEDFKSGYGVLKYAITGLNDLNQKLTSYC